MLFQTKQQWSTSSPPRRGSFVPHTIEDLHCIYSYINDIAYKKFQIYFDIMAGIILITLDNASIKI